MAGRPPVNDAVGNFLCFYMDRERGRGDPISITVHRHPHKKHFGKPADDTNYDPAKPHMPLAKVKLHLSDYDELDPYAAKDTEFIVNVPFQKHTGDFIEVMIGDKIKDTCIGVREMSDTASSIESTARVPRTGSYMFVMGRERGQGDPISITQLHHPHKKHNRILAEDSNYSLTKPNTPLPKVKLHLSHYRELDPNVAKDTEFIVNVPNQSHTGDSIEVMIGDKVITVEIPRLVRRQNRFIVCFI